MPRSSSRRETCTTGVSAIGHSSSSGFLKLDFALLARIFVLRPVQLVVLLVLALRPVLLVTVRPPLLGERRAAVIEPNLAVALRNHPQILLRRLDITHHHRFIRRHLNAAGLVAPMQSQAARVTASIADCVA